MAAFVEASLPDINNLHEGALGAMLQSLQSDILARSEGKGPSDTCYLLSVDISSRMFLWVHLVLGLLKNAGSVGDLRLQISSLPASLAEAYGCSSNRRTTAPNRVIATARF